MKIAFIGSHCSGKSSAVSVLGDRLRQDGHKVQTIMEVASECPYTINEGTNLKSQLWILLKQIERESSLIQSEGYLLCDRSVFDNLAYSEYQVIRKNMALEEYQAMLNIAQSWTLLQPYTFLFYVPPLPLKQASYRSPNVVFQKEIDERVRIMVDKLQLPVVYLPSEALEQRVSRVYTLVEEYSKGVDQSGR